MTQLIELEGAVASQLAWSIIAKLEGEFVSVV